MSDWRTYRLHELCEFINGFAFKSTDYVAPSIDTIEVFRMGYISRGGGFKEDDSPVFIPKNYYRDLSKFYLEPGDVTIAMTDMKDRVAILGNTAWIRDENRFVLNQRVGCIRVKRHDLLDPKFFYFYSNWSPYIEYLRSRANSGVQVNLSTTAIKDSELHIPPLSEQRAVAHILGTLDNKITLNRQINQTLEELAQALFKSWFVDFEPVKAKLSALAAGGSADDANLAAMSAISGKTTEQLLTLKTTHPDQYQQLYTTADLFPSEMVDSELGEIPKGWEVKAFGDVVEFQNGCAFKSEELTDNPTQGTHKVFKMGNIVKGGGFNRDGSKDYFDLNKSPKNERYLIKKGDLLMCMTDMKNNVALLGHTALMPISDQYLVNQRVGLIRKSKFNYLNYPFLYYQTNEPLFLLDLRSRANSGVQVNLSTSAIKETLILVPSKEIHEVFHAQATNYLEQIFCNDEETENLKAIRDALLPKLLSGELLVDD